MLSTSIFARIRISPEEISNSYVANKKSPRRGETKLRKNEMKLRRNEIISPKNFSTPHWIIRDLYQGVFDFLHRELDGLIIYNVSALLSNL